MKKNILLPYLVIILMIILSISCNTSNSSKLQLDLSALGITLNDNKEYILPNGWILQNLEISNSVNGRVVSTSSITFSSIDKTSLAKPSFSFVLEAISGSDNIISMSGEAIDPKIQAFLQSNQKNMLHNGQSEFARVMGRKSVFVSELTEQKVDHFYIVPSASINLNVHWPIDTLDSDHIEIQLVPVDKDAVSIFQDKKISQDVLKKNIPFLQNRENQGNRIEMNVPEGSYRMEAKRITSAKSTEILSHPNGVLTLYSGRSHETFIEFSPIEQLYTFDIQVLFESKSDATMRFKFFPINQKHEYYRYNRPIVGIISNAKYFGIPLDDNCQESANTLIDISKEQAQIDDSLNGSIVFQQKNNPLLSCAFLFASVFTSTTAQEDKEPIAITLFRNQYYDGDKKEIVNPVIFIPQAQHSLLGLSEHENLNSKTNFDALLIHDNNIHLSAKHFVFYETINENEKVFYTERNLLIKQDFSIQKDEDETKENLSYFIPKAISLLVPPKDNEIWFIPLGVSPSDDNRLLGEPFLQKQIIKAVSRAGYDPTELALYDVTIKADGNDIDVLMFDGKKKYYQLIISVESSNIFSPESVVGKTYYGPYKNSLHFEKKDFPLTTVLDLEHTDVIDATMLMIHIYNREDESIGFFKSIPIIIDSGPCNDFSPFFPDEKCGGICNTAVYSCNSNYTATICIDALEGQKKVGTPCGGKCNSATYQCSVDNTKTICDDPISSNFIIGSHCGGICNTAVYQCNSDNTDIICLDPLKGNQAVGTNCGGKCGTATYQCNNDNTKTECVDPLENKPEVGTNCGGKCGTATYQCNSNNTDIECADPFSTKPEVGTNCGGKCGTATYQCNNNNSDVICVDLLSSKPNIGDPCGGICNTALYQCNDTGEDIICVDSLANKNLKPVGTLCGGKCGTATYQCNQDKTETVCIDPLLHEPTIGASCGGICNTAVYQCSANKKHIECVDPLEGQHKIGESCGGQCGTAYFVCNDNNTKTICYDPLNNLSKVGTSCGGKCGTATYQCNEFNTSIECVDPLIDAPDIGKHCGGICGTATYQCSLDKSEVICYDPLEGFQPVGMVCGGNCGTAKYRCNSRNTATVCVDDLAHQIPVGTSCGKCNTGKYVCTADNTKTICDDPLENAVSVGTACGGQCGTATYQCNLDKSDTICVDPLQNEPQVGSTCGKCNTGNYICAQDNKTILCDDPLADKPQPGLSCGGVCDSAVYSCNSDKSDILCVDLAATSTLPGTPCGGKCQSATYVCDTDKKSTHCNDPVIMYPDPGTPCGGICDTATYRCNQSGTDITCVDPLENEIPEGTRCGGICGTAEYTCNSNDTQTECVDPISFSPYTYNGPCPGGKCNSAFYTCSDDGKFLECRDPHEFAPDPLSSCGGLCNTATFQCVNNNTSISCIDPLENSPIPRSACGVCNSGVYECKNNNTIISCTDPVAGSINIGTFCPGLCDTASYQCADNDTTTKCTDSNREQCPIVGNMLQFNGSQFVTIPNNSVYDTATFTLEGWINVAGITGTDMGILSHGTRGLQNASNRDNYDLLMNGQGYLQLSYEDATGTLNHFIANKKALIPNNFSHIAVTRDSAGIIIFYINGLAVQNFMNTPDPGIANDVITIGRYCVNSTSCNTAYYFYGIIDEVRIWNTALSAEQIRSRFYRLVYNTESNLIGYYNFNSSGGQNIYDRSRYLNHGILGKTSSSELFDPLWTTVNWNLCGNNVRDSAEQCDGSLSESITCSAIGAISGNLVNCTSQCFYDTSQCIFEDSNLITWYNFDNDTTSVEDVSSYSHNAILFGTPQLGVAGKRGNGVLLNDNNDYLLAFHSNALNLTNFTIEAWVYRNSITSVDYIVSKGQDLDPAHAFNYSFGFGSSDGSCAPTALLSSFELSQTAEKRFTCTQPMFDLKQWYHIATTYDQNKLKIYSNGVLQTSKSETNIPNQNQISLLIGRRSTIGSAEETFDGILDDIRIWKSARSEDQICKDAGGIYTTTGQTGSCHLGNYALRFDGTGRFLKLGAFNTYKTSDATIEFSIFFPVSFGGMVFGINESSTCNASDIYIESSGQVTAYFLADCGRGEKATTNNNLILNTWNHVAIVYNHDGGVERLRIFINGEPQNVTRSLNNAKPDDRIFNPTQTMKIGVHSINGSLPLNAIIDELRFWAKIRLKDDIKLKMYQELTGQEEGLIGYFRFNGGTGQVVTDSKGLNHGMLGNSTSFETVDPQWVISNIPIQ